MITNGLLALLFTIFAVVECRTWLKLLKDPQKTKEWVRFQFFWFVLNSVIAGTLIVKIFHG
jgi:hypothetical protein